MQLKKSIFATTALTLSLAIGGTLLLQPTSAVAAKAGKAGKAAGKEDKKDAKVMGALTPNMLEKVYGKPLTPEQESAIEDAQKAYVGSVAKAMGTTPEELFAKVKEYRAEHKGHGKKAAATAAPAAAAKP